jgi:hypothetical protein
MFCAFELFYSVVGQYLTINAAQALTSTDTKDTKIDQKSDKLSEEETALPRRCKPKVTPPDSRDIPAASSTSSTSQPPRTLSRPARPQQPAASPAQTSVVDFAYSTASSTSGGARYRTDRGHPPPEPIRQESVIEKTEITHHVCIGYGSTTRR